jgi:hypothetical protein
MSATWRLLTLVGDLRIGERAVLMLFPAVGDLDARPLWGGDVGGVRGETIYCNPGGEKGFWGCCGCCGVRCAG